MGVEPWLNEEKAWGDRWRDRGRRKAGCGRSKSAPGGEKPSGAMRKNCPEQRQAEDHSRVQWQSPKEPEQQSRDLEFTGFDTGGHAKPQTA